MSRVLEWVALASRALRRYPPLDGRVTYKAAAVAAIAAAAAAHLDARRAGGLKRTEQLRAAKARRIEFIRLKYKPQPDRKACIALRAEIERLLGDAGYVPPLNSTEQIDEIAEALVR